MLVKKQQLINCKSIGHLSFAVSTFHLLVSFFGFHGYLTLVRSLSAGFIVTWPHRQCLSDACGWALWLSALMDFYNSCQQQNNEISIASELVFVLQRLFCCIEIWVLMGGVSHRHVKLCSPVPMRLFEQGSLVIQNRPSEFDWRWSDLLNLRILCIFSELV